MNCFYEFYSDFIFITGLGLKKEKALIYSPTVLSNPFLLIKRYAFAKNVILVILPGIEKNNGQKFANKKL